MKNWGIPGLASILLLLSMPIGANAASTAAGEWQHAGFTQWHTQSGKYMLGSAGTQCYFCKPDADPDDDGDGVPNHLDQCPNTPPKVKVNAQGCAIDSDGDGVPDYLDKCSATPANVAVDANGCTKDSDGDGVTDHLDKCPNTPKGAKVTSQGCWTIKNLNFRFDKAVIDTVAASNLNGVLAILKKNPSMKVNIQGHTDSIGTFAYNQTLSEKRAIAAMAYLIKHGIDKSRLSSMGFGETKPIASNMLNPGRAENRRAELRHK